MSVNRIVTTMAAGGAVLALLAVPGLGARTPQQEPGAQTSREDPSATGDTQKPGAGMMARCQEMMAQRQQMMAEMKASDQRLDDLVAKMNAASGTEQTAATAAVVNEMVAQRRKHRDAMMSMQQGMMGHMMQHMQAGKGSMTACPMMKQRSGARP